jgi:glycosyltransferase involved in cell wall biosynthesis
MFMSLIVCTKDRASQLEQCLNEMAAATPPPCDMEIVVVDNGSRDATKSVIGAFAARAPYKVSIVDCAIAGLGRARNAGLSAAQGEWLLFTDDDCYVETNFLRNFFEFATAAAGADNGA